MVKKHYIIPIFVPHEGCPHDCAFCNQGKITGEEIDSIVGPKYKLENKVDAEFVLRTVEEYLETIDRENSTLELSFFGGTFTAININKQKELLAVAKKYKEEKLIDFIRLSTRPDYIDEKILNHLKFYNVDIIELGVQSLDEKVLEEARRGHSAEDVIKASKLINDYGFTLGHQIMLGLPGDNRDRDIETTKKSIAMNPKICRIYPALTIKDTPMEYMYEKGTYKPYSLEECIEIAKECYCLYKEANVNVIRIGLQPTDNIAEGKDIVAGPFHPAFRELVESSLLNEAIYDLAMKNNFEGDIFIKIHNNKVSRLYADKKKYFLELKENLKEHNIKVEILKEENLLDEILVKNNNKEYSISL
ncbi:MAG: elongator complex protein 3 [Sarcina sp.]